MRPGDPAFASRPASEPAWQRLAEFSLPAEFGSECLIGAKVVEAVQGLHLPAAYLERLKMAVARAAFNAIKSGRRYQPKVAVVVRVLISDRDLPPPGTDQRSRSPFPKSETPPDLTTALTGQELPQGWGFFLVEKRADEPQVDNEAAHHTIELFLYSDG